MLNLDPASMKHLVQNFQDHDSIKTAILDLVKKRGKIHLDHFPNSGVLVGRIKVSQAVVVTFSLSRQLEASLHTEISLKELRSFPCVH